MNVFNPSELSQNLKQTLESLWEQIKSIPEEKSIAVDKIDFNIETLIEICNNASDENFKVLAIDHGTETIEIYRTSSIIPVSAFYKQMETNSKSADVNSSFKFCISKVKSVISKYQNKSIDTIIKSCQISKEAKEAGLIPYTYLQRNCVAYSVFRNHPGNSTETLKKALEVLCLEGVVRVESEYPLIYKIL